MSFLIRNKNGLRGITSQQRLLSRFFSSELDDRLWTKGLDAKEEGGPTNSTMAGHNEKYFKEHVNMHFFGGKGGFGTVSWKHVKRGRFEPNGGDGGDGGDVYLRATIDNPDLSYVKSKVRKTIFNIEAYQGQYRKRWQGGRLCCQAW